MPIYNDGKLSYCVDWVTKNNYQELQVLEEFTSSGKVLASISSTGEIIRPDEGVHELPKSKNDVLSWCKKLYIYHNLLFQSNYGKMQKEQRNIALEEFERFLLADTSEFIPINMTRA